jgi:hypothetical protein
MGHEQNETERIRSGRLTPPSQACMAERDHEAATLENQAAGYLFPLEGLKICRREITKCRWTGQAA